MEFPLLLVGGAVVAVMASKDKAKEDALVAAATPVAAQQVAQGVPLATAATNAAKIVVGGFTLAQPVTSTGVHIEGGRQSGPWRVSWDVYKGFGKPTGKWISFFDTAAEANTFMKFQQAIGSGFISNLKVTGPGK
jgi:hypothetical protein